MVQWYPQREPEPSRKNFREARLLPYPKTNSRRPQQKRRRWPPTRRGAPRNWFRGRSVRYGDGMMPCDNFRLSDRTLVKSGPGSGRGLRSTCRSYGRFDFYAILSPLNFWSLFRRFAILLCSLLMIMMMMMSMRQRH
ncbi:hypothetical protein GWI33_019409 [Rhynchophorus ferrugineus]|uniref:Uncharacterized protein n=1 Tax=Rhynchophorus ferrugineus TaxID=354439 RepID=A0A834HW46_RHYFE|nr:hypothetical protein GWI33_019409 [Rhynchophorus ferrugineus]